MKKGILTEPDVIKDDLIAECRRRECEECAQYRGYGGIPAEVVVINAETGEHRFICQAHLVATTVHWTYD